MDLKKKQKSIMFSSWRDPEPETLQTVKDIQEDTGASYTDVMKLITRLGLKSYLTAKPKAAKKAKPKEMHIDFDFFWDIYPKKTYKVQAEKAWNKLNPNEEAFELIKSHLARAYIDTPKQFLPKGVNYLTEKIWTEEIITTAEKSYGHQSKPAYADQARGLFETRGDNSGAICPNEGLVRVEVDKQYSRD